MEDLRFCPKCGKKTLTWDGVVKWQCESCDFVLFHNTAAAVAVVLQYNDELFLTVRNQNPGIGKLDLPGGFSDPKERSEETCARELKEELDLDINPENFKYLGSQPNVYPYKNMDYNTLDFFFRYDVEEKFEIKLEESEISAGIWIHKSKINFDDIAFESQKRFLKNYLKTC